MPILLTDRLTLPIDEGMKKFTFQLFQYAAGRDRFRLLTSPEPLPIPGVETYRATKGLFGGGLLRKIGRGGREPVLYVPAASTTFASFLRAWTLKLFLPGSRITLVSLQRRRHRAWEAPFLRAGRFQIATFSPATRDQYAALGLAAVALTPGVDADAFQPADPAVRATLRAQRGWKPDETVALHVGHVRASRHLDVLAQLPARGLRTVVVGSPHTPRDDRTARCLQEAGVEVDVRYHPRIEEWYQAADVYVFPVVQETGAIEFPLSILEAMGCDLPVVTTPFGGVGAAFRESPGFRFFRPGDDLADRIREALASGSPGNRDVVLRDFTWNQAFARLLAVL